MPNPFAKSRKTESPYAIYSYGGTSLLATMAGLGIVLGVRLRRRM